MQVINILIMSLFRDVFILIESTRIKRRTTITTTWRFITSYTFKRDKIRARKFTNSSKNALTIITAFKWKRTLIRDKAAEFNLFSDSRLILTDRFSDIRFRATINDAKVNDATLLKSKMRKRINTTHINHPFKDDRDDI